MTRKGFEYNPEAAGTTFVGKVQRAEEMTAGEFDAIRGASLSAKMGEDTVVFYLEVSNLTYPGRGDRSTFFLPETSPVSKWMRLLTALDRLGIRIGGGQELVGRYFVWQEKQIPVGKYGTANTLEPIGVPTQEEVLALEAQSGQATGSPAASPAVVPMVDWDTDVENAIRAMADGKTRAELEQLLTEYYPEWVQGQEARVKTKITGLLTGGKLKVQGGKLVVA